MKKYWFRIYYFNLHFFKIASYKYWFFIPISWEGWLIFLGLAAMNVLIWSKLTEESPLVPDFLAALFILVASIVLVIVLARSKGYQITWSNKN